MSAICVISSRWESTRFPGKPLALINGYEMILWVADACKNAVSIDNVYIGTDNKKISDCVINNGYKVININTKRCDNCSDATAEVINNIDCDVVVDVQGDEPLIKSEDILCMITTKRLYHNYIINAYTDENDPKNKNTIKIIKKGNGNLIYASREPIPFNSPVYNKQVGIYCFYKNQLLELYGYDKEKSFYERHEKIHILRCLENDKNIFMVYLHGKYQSVDVPEDIKKVENILNEHERSK